jgi:hypothetical protein
MINPEKRWLEKFSMDYPSDIFANYQKFNSKVKAKKRITHAKEIYSQTSILHLNSNREFKLSVKSGYETGLNLRTKSYNEFGQIISPNQADKFALWYDVLEITGYICLEDELRQLRMHANRYLSDLILEYFSLIADWNTNDNQIAYARSIDKRHEILCYIETLYGKEYPNFPLGYKK